MRNILTFCAGALVAGESLILLVGMNLPRPGAWSTPINVSLAASDVLLGGFLVFLVLSRAGYERMPLYFLAVGLLLATHAWRTWEYLSGRPAPFAASPALFVANIVRLALTVASPAWTLATRA